MFAHSIPPQSSQPIPAPFLAAPIQAALHQEDNTPQKLYLDLETYSETPIAHGTHAYAENAEIMLFAWALDDAPVNVWDCTAQSIVPAALLRAFQNSSVEIWAHNSHFDRTLLAHAGFPSAKLAARDAFNAQHLVLLRVDWPP